MNRQEYHALSDGMWRMWQDYHLYESNETNPKDKDWRIYWVYKHLKDKPVNTILDVGCGNGWHSHYLSAKGYSIEGRDYSSSGIRIARQMNPTLKFKTEDAEKMKDENAYDVVLCLAVLNSSYMPAEIIKNVFKASKKWVYFSIIKYKSDPLHRWLWTSDEIKSMLTKYGKLTDEQGNERQHYFELEKYERPIP